MNCRICGAPLPPGAMFCGECGSSTSATPESRQRPRSGGDTSIITPLPAPAAGRLVRSRGAAETGDTTSSAATAADAAERPAGRPSFVLRFSTGESVVVSGSGLIGRRPVMAPSENVERLVPIADHGLSVSKTHLEFGVHEDSLWVNDRFSGNGTLIHRPDGTDVRCDPGRRHLVPRGARVDIGEQFFIVE